MDRLGLGGLSDSRNRPGLTASFGKALSTRPSAVTSGTPSASASATYLQSEEEQFERAASSRTRRDSTSALKREVVARPTNSV